MGVVYKAYDPDLNRQVALKLVRAAVSRASDPAMSRNRLLREAQGLAQLSHPNVVAVYDVGLFDDGVFLAMELVSGPTLRAWLATKPTYRDTLNVLVAVGEGLATAHRAGLVHRDVKPANVILGDDGRRPRVLDFGLVRALDSDERPDGEQPPGPSESEFQSRDRSLSFVSSQPSLATHASLALTSQSDSESAAFESERSDSQSSPLTRVGAILGTPRYMSPEQLLGRPATEKSDQFSFCVALYEALYGKPPFRGKSLHSLRDEICAGRVRPPPARARVPANVRRAIVKGLAPNPDKRYPSMQDLLAELARDPARTRRRWLVSAAVAASLAFGSWAVVTGRHKRGLAICDGAAAELEATWNPERRETVWQAFVASGVSYANDTFERVSATLDAYGQDWVSLRTKACEATHIRGVQSETVLDLRMGCLDRRLNSLDALVDVFAEAPDSDVISNAVEASLGLGKISFCSDVEALALKEPSPENPEDRKTLAALRTRLETIRQLDRLGKSKNAQTLVEALGPEVDALGFPPLQAEYGYYSAAILAALGKYAEAEPKLQESLQVALLWRMNELATRAGALATYVVGYRLRRHAEGLVYALHAHGLNRGRGDELEALSLNNLATVYYVQAKYAEAAELHERTLAIRKKVRGPDHPDVARSFHNLSHVYRELGQNDKAATFARQALEIREASLGKSHPDVAKSLSNLALVYWSQRKYPEAEQLYKRAIALQEETLGADHPQVTKPLNNLGLVYWDQGRHADAERLYKRALAIREKSLGPDHPLVATPLNNLANIYYAQGLNAKSEELNRRALEIWSKTLGPEHPNVAHALLGLGLVGEKEKRFSEARGWLEQAREIRETRNATAKDRAEVAFALARVLWASGNERPRARSLATEALELYESGGPDLAQERSDVTAWLAAR